MKIDYKVPFFSNTEDNTHCLQAVLKMILKYYFPEEEYSWQQLDEISQKREGLWTYGYAALLFLKDKGLSIEIKDLFDHNKFIRKGGDYLIEEFGEELGRAQIQHSDIEQGRSLAKELISKIDIIKEEPMLEDVINLLNDGYLVCCNVNEKRLNGKEGYSGHFVLIKGFNKDGFIVHDPGLPAFKNRKVEFNTFESAWAYPSNKAKNYTALRFKD
jgi:hypothetical protein